MKNILITSAGKRVTLVEIFKKALKSYGSEAMVYTTDTVSYTHLTLPTT
mgnify:CR=1 FL=1